MHQQDRQNFLNSIDPSDGLYTATEAATRLGITPQLISQWKRAGKITPVATYGRSPVYRYADLARVERETRRSPFNLRRVA